jgi:hypothetical protein
MFTTGSAIKNNTTTYFITGATTNTSVTSVKSFEIPPNCNFLTITACGAGGAGGSGTAAATTSQRWGGGGGASGTVMSAMFPRFALPNIIYMSIGAGGIGGTGNGQAGAPGQNTFVSTSANNTAGVLLQATGGNGGGGGSTSTSGPGGSAPSSPFTYASGEQGITGYFAWSPNYTFYDARPGQANTVNYPNNYFTCVSGGAPGGFANSVTGTAYRAGYGYFLPIGNSGAYDTFGIYYGGVNDASNVGLPGNGGFMSLNPFLMSGGTGGAGTYNGAGFAGGIGAPGCGGGGGGAGTSSGNGGNGGDGWVLINCW